MKFHLTVPILITESLAKVRGVLSDLAAVFTEAVRVWKRLRAKRVRLAVIRNDSSIPF